MKTGITLHNPMVDRNGNKEGDAPMGVTMSPSDRAELIKVYKCVRCGHSFT